MTSALMAFASALAVGIGALATGYAQARIGSAGAGAMAEKPELAPRIMILLVLPETIVLFGFVIAVLILFVK